MSSLPDPAFPVVLNNAITTIATTLPLRPTAAQLNTFVEQGDLSSLQYFLARGVPRLQTRLEPYIEHACKLRHWNIVEWYFNTFQGIVVPYYVINHAVSQHNWEMAWWVRRKVDSLGFVYHIDHAIVTCIDEDDIPGLEWILTHWCGRRSESSSDPSGRRSESSDPSGRRSESPDPSENLYAVRHFQSRVMSSATRPNIQKWIHALYPVEFGAQLYACLRQLTNCPATFEWIKTMNFSMHNMSESEWRYVVNNAINHNNLPVLEWLLAQRSIELVILYDTIIVHHNQSMLEWVYAKWGFESMKENDIVGLFERSISNGNLHAIQWLYGNHKETLGVSTNHGRWSRKAILSNNSVPIMNWLQEQKLMELSSDMFVDIRDDKGFQWLWDNRCPMDVEMITTGMRLKMTEIVKRVVTMHPEWIYLEHVITSITYKQWELTDLMMSYLTKEFTLDDAKSTDYVLKSAFAVGNSPYRLNWAFKMFHAQAKLNRWLHHWMFVDPFNNCKSNAYYFTWLYQHGFPYQYHTDMISPSAGKSGDYQYRGTFWIYLVPHSDEWINVWKKLYIRIESRACYLHDWVGLKQLQQTMGFPMVRKAQRILNFYTRLLNNSIKLPNDLNRLIWKFI